MKQEKFKLIVKRSEINDLEKRITSGQLKTIDLLGQKYILDVTETADQIEIRVYPVCYTYNGRNDGYLLIVSNHTEDHEKYLLGAYTEVINMIMTSGFGPDLIMEIDETK